MIKYCHEKNKNQKEVYSANTEFTPGQLELQGLETVKTRKIIVRNDGKANSSDAGLLLLQQVEQKHRIIEKLSRCFTDCLLYHQGLRKGYGTSMSEGISSSFGGLYKGSLNVQTDILTQTSFRFLIGTDNL